MALALKDHLARQAAGEMQLAFDPTGRDEPRLVMVPLDRIEPDPNQPRKDLGEITGLAASIREHGLLSPLIVEALPPGRYRLIAGQRRWAACRHAGLGSAPCIVRTVAEQSRLALQLIENIHRKDLHPVEVAQAYRRLMDEFNLEQSTLAQRLGVAASSINETLRLLDLSPDLLPELRTSEPLTKSVLLEIAKVPDLQQQKALLLQAKAGNLTARQARAAKQSARASKPRRATVTINLEEATVVVRFGRGEASPERVVATLQRALASQNSPS